MRVRGEDKSRSSWLASDFSNLSHMLRACLVAHGREDFTALSCMARVFSGLFDSSQTLRTCLCVLRPVSLFADLPRSPYLVSNFEGLPRSPLARFGCCGLALDPFCSSLSWRTCFELAGSSQLARACLGLLLLVSELEGLPRNSLMPRCSLSRLRFRGPASTSLARPCFCGLASDSDSRLSRCRLAAECFGLSQLLRTCRSVLDSSQRCGRASVSSGSSQT